MPDVVILIVEYKNTNSAAHKWFVIRFKAFSLSCCLWDRKDPVVCRLREVTLDISKSVFFTILEPHRNLSQDCIPESISRPQKLKILQLDRGAITDVPSGLERLANLCDLVIRGCNQTLRFPLSLQVNDRDCW